MGLMDFAKRWKDALAARKEMAEEAAAESVPAETPPSWRDTRAARKEMEAEVYEGMDLEMTQSSQPPRTPSEPKIKAAAADTTPLSPISIPASSRKGTPIHTPLPHALRPEELAAAHEISENAANRVKAGGTTYDIRDLERDGIPSSVPQGDWPELATALRTARNSVQDAHGANRDTVLRAEKLAIQAEELPNAYQNAVVNEYEGVTLEYEETKLLLDVRAKVSKDLAAQKTTEEAAKKDTVPAFELEPDSVQPAGSTPRVTGRGAGADR